MTAIPTSISQPRAVAGDSSIGGGAAINHGTVIVDDGVTLTLGDATLNGTFVHVGVDATLHVDGPDAMATFDGVEVFNEGTIQVDNNEQPTTLIGTDGTTIRAARYRSAPAGWWRARPGPARSASCSTM
jgi:hypothetical protein